MACDECIELRRRVADMRAELQEWRLYDPDRKVTDGADISRWLGIQSQQAGTVLARLLSRPGATISRDILVEDIGYDGENRAGVIQCLIAKIRTALFDRGLPTIRNKWGHGYTIDRNDAVEIRQAMEKTKC